MPTEQVPSDLSYGTSRVYDSSKELMFAWCTDSCSKSGTRKICVCKYIEYKGILLWHKV